MTAPHTLRVLLLATTTGYQIRSFGEAADALGVRLVLASDRCDQLDDPWWDGAIPVRFHDPAASIEAVRAACGGGHVLHGVLAVGDRPAVLAAHIAGALGLPGNPPAAAEASRNELAARRAFAGAGLSTPSLHVIPVSQPFTELPDVDYPVVVKPLALSGSRGVIRVDDRTALEQAVDRVRRLLQSPDIAIERDRAHEQLLIESFIPGEEYAIEGIVTDGAVQVFAIFDKPDPLDGPFFEETIYVTPSRAPARIQEAIREAVSRAVIALGLRRGPIHAECRVNEQRVFVLEVAPRPIGGLCSRVLRFCAPDGGEATLEEVLLRHAIGAPVSDYRLVGPSTGVMMIPIPRPGVYRSVSGVDFAKTLTGIDDIRITAKPDSVLVPLPEGGSYLGFIFARAGEPAAVECALRDAHAQLQFVIDREVALAR